MILPYREIAKNLTKDTFVYMVLIGNHKQKEWENGCHRSSQDSADPFP